MSALSEAVGDLAARRSQTVTITEYVNMLGGTGRGGGTARAAAAIGVSQREVQRYLKAERGEGGQVRNPPRVRIHGVSRDIVLRELRQHGGAVTHIRYTDDYDGRDRLVTRPVEITAMEMRTALDWSDEDELLTGMGQDEAFGQAFIGAYFGGDQRVSDVYDIRLELR